MESDYAARMFEPFEEPIGDWAEFQSAVNDLTAAYDYKEFAWRGHRRSEWGVRSSLYRALQDVDGRPPTEDDLVAAERRILKLARTDWRFDQMSALELFARLQHQGGPTRLLDVTENPLIALWFAVEQSQDDDEHDSRVLAFVVGRQVQLDRFWGAREPRWHSFHTEEVRRQRHWGTGAKRRLWRPPAFDARIAAQGAAFLIDGAPIAGDEDRIFSTDPDADRANLAIDAVREVSSFRLRLSAITSYRLRRDASPVFTLRIRSSAKAQIRLELERRYGYRASSIYPDVAGLGQALNLHPDLLTEK